MDLKPLPRWEALDAVEDGLERRGGGGVVEVDVGHLAAVEERDGAVHAHDVVAHVVQRDAGGEVVTGLTQIDRVVRM